MNSQDYKIKKAFECLSEKTFEAGRLAEFKAEVTPILWRVIEAYDGSIIADMDDDELDQIKHTLSAALKIEKSELEVSGVFSPSKSLEILTSLRKGQPSPDFMWEFSPWVKRHVEFINNSISKGRSFFKLIVGNPGTGKTTFRNIVASKIPASSLIVSHTFGSQYGKSNLNLASTILFDKKIVVDCVNKLYELKQSNAAEFYSVIQKVEGFNYFQVMSVLFAFSERSDADESITQFSDRYHAGITRWLELDRSLTLSTLNREHGIKTGLMPRPTEANILDFTNQFIRFYSAIGVHPVWLLDEFEAHENLRASSIANVMDYFRGFYDILANPEISGYCLIFSTESGKLLINKYPALKDRLSTGNGVALSSTEWKMSKFDKWNSATILRAIKSLYQSASCLDPLVTGEAYQNMLNLGDGFDKKITRELEKPSVPRHKLMELTLNIIDPLSESSTTSITDSEDHLDSCYDCLESGDTSPKVELDKVHDTFRIELKDIDKIAHERIRYPRYPEDTPVQKLSGEHVNRTLEEMLRQIEIIKPSIKHGENSDDIDISDPFSTSSDDDFSTVEYHENDGDSGFFDFDSPEGYLTAIDLTGSDIYDNCGIEFEILTRSGLVEQKRRKPWSISSMFSFGRRKDEGLSSYLTVKNDLIRFSGVINSNNAKAILKDFGSSSSRSNIAKKYSRLRDLGQSRIDLELAMGSLDVWTGDLSLSDAAVNLNILMSASLSGLKIPVAKRVKEQSVDDDLIAKGSVKKKSKYKDVIESFDILSSLSVTRTFVYTYLFNHGIIPNDFEVDEFVIQWHKIKGMEEPIPSRNGVMFYTSRDGFAESISDTYY